MFLFVINEIKITLWVKWGWKSPIDENFAGEQSKVFIFVFLVRLLLLLITSNLLTEELHRFFKEALRPLLKVFEMKINVWTNKLRTRNRYGNRCHMKLIQSINWEKNLLHEEIYEAEVGKSLAGLGFKREILSSNSEFSVLAYRIMTRFYCKNRFIF